MKKRRRTRNKKKRKKKDGEQERRKNERRTKERRNKKKRNKHKARTRVESGHHRKLSRPARLCKGYATPSGPLVLYFFQGYALRSSLVGGSQLGWRPRPRSRWAKGRVGPWWHGKKVEGRRRSVAKVDS